MSIGNVNRFHHENINGAYNTISFNISEIVIPFSRLFNKCESADIYSGIERIPFKERNAEYRTILQQEFIGY
ncbi:MAG: hypothetical protein ACFFCE_11305 [Promethearchaeota archaeon]